MQLYSRLIALPSIGEVGDNVIYPVQMLVYGSNMFITQLLMD